MSINRNLANIQFAGMWKKAVVGYFEIMSWHLLGMTEENHKNLNSLLAEI
jgi:hypothetical protein